MNPVQTFHIGGQKISQNKPLFEYIKSIESGLYLLDSPTSSGKSYMVGQYSTTKRKVLVLTPFIALGSNIKSELNRMCQPFIDTGKSVTICNGTEKNWSGDVVICTYDQFVSEDVSAMEFEAIFIDEPQSLYEDSYRDVMVATFEKLKEMSESVPVWCLSATLIEGYLNIAHTVKVTADYEFTPDAEVVIGKGDLITVEFIQAAIEAHQNGGVVVMLRNHKSDLLSIQRALDTQGISSTILDADHKEDPKTVAMLETKICDDPVLLMTKAGQAGVSILNTNLAALYCVYDEGMTPESLKQYVSRFRTNYNPKLIMCFNVDTDKEYSMAAFAEKWNDSDRFIVEDEMSRSRSILDRIRMFLQGICEDLGSDGDKHARDLFRSMRTSHTIPDHIKYDAVMDDTVSDVIVAQITEKRRQGHYGNALGQMIRQVAPLFSAGEESPEHVQFSDLAVKTLVEYKATASEKRAFKRNIKAKFWEQIMTNGTVSPLTLTGLSAGEQQVFEEVYSDFQSVVGAAQMDGVTDADWQVLKTLKVDSLNSYDSIGRAAVVHKSMLDELRSTDWLGDLVGTPIPTKHAKQLVKCWVCGNAGLSESMRLELNGDAVSVEPDFETNPRSPLAKTFAVMLNERSDREQKQMFELLLKPKTRRVGARGQREKCIVVG